MADTDFNGSDNSSGGGVAVPPVEDLILSLLDVEVVRGRSIDLAAKAISSNLSMSLVVVVLLLVGASSATSDM